MECPNCRHNLETVEISGIHVDRCPNCQGIWFDKNELRVLKDRQDNGDYHWLNVDLWRDIDKFRARRQQRYKCPKDGNLLTTVHYGESKVAVDICSMCHGMWLDHEEYREIIRYLEETVDSSTASDYLKDVRNEFVEVFEGRESPLGALQDIGKILYLLEVRFTVEHPTLAQMMTAFPRF